MADMWAPTREEEHAVSMDNDGPFKPSEKLMRPHTTLHRHKTTAQIRSQNPSKLHLLE